MKKAKSEVPTAIHVNTAEIKKNAVRARRGEPLKPVILARPKNGKGPAEYGDTVSVKHQGVVVARVVYRPQAPLKSGAVCWVETDCEVEVESGAGTVSAPAQLHPAVSALLAALVEHHGDEVRRMLAQKGA